MDKYKKICITILIIIGTGCLTAACILGIRHFLQDRAARENLESLRASAEAAMEDTMEGTTEDTTEGTMEGSAEGTIEGSVEGTAAGDAEEKDAAGEAAGNQNTEFAPATDPAIPNPYRDSFLANEDMAAWLQIADTVIDYPVMWTPRDENYYLYRDFEGNENQNGCLILDTDSSLDPLTTNLIIHGHNMRSGAMFGNLTDYESQEFYENHKQITLYTEECQRNYEVIAVFRSQVYKKTDTVFKFYKFFQADTQEEFDDFYQNIKALSLYDTGVTAQFGDHFLTLSTCVYHVERGRFVVVAKEVESGDSYLPVQE